MSNENLSQEEEKDLANKVNFENSSKNQNHSEDQDLSTKPKHTNTTETENKNSSSEKNEEKNDVKSTLNSLDKGYKIIEAFNNATAAVKSLIIIVGVLFVAFNIYSFYKAIVSNAKEETKITNSLVGNYVKKSQDIVSYKYFYTNAAMFENKKNIYGFDLPLTSKKFIISYSGKAALGVDLSQIKTDIKGNKIIISNLGKVKILSNELDEKSMKIFDESTSLFSSWNIKDYQNFFADQKGEVEKKIMESELPQQAKTSAEETIKQLLMLNPQISSQYEIEFKDK